MEKGAKALFYILLYALLSGALFTALHPMYRQGLLALWRARPDENPIWQSNARFYVEIQLPAQQGEAGDAK